MILKRIHKLMRGTSLPKGDDPKFMSLAGKRMMVGSALSITRRDFHCLALGAAASILSPKTGFADFNDVGSFQHPGILHSAADLDRMRKGARIAGTPIAAGFAKLRIHEFSQSSYKPHEFGNEVGRNPSVNVPAFDEDCNAAYQCSLMAAITGEMRYAEIARSILLGWSGTLQIVSGADAVLMAGLGPFKWINAAEILRALGELDSAAVARCAAMLRSAILPAIIDFAPFANGNWDTAAIKTLMALAVFCDDRSLFERALFYYLHGDGDGRLIHYIYENGQCQESGRDQQHTQLGLAHLGDACQIAWNQGLDLFGAVENRLLRGFEYTAAYNLGEDVEFHPNIDRTGKYRHDVISPRGELRPIYEQIFAHYHVRRGLTAPAVEKAVAKLRPEGAAQGADHTGFGTLLYALDESPVLEQVIPAAAAALAAYPQEDGIHLEWLIPREDDLYSVQRAAGRGSFHTIVTRIKNANYVDSSVHAGEFYRYRVASHSATSRQAISEVAQIVNGIPRGWTHHALGDLHPPGRIQFDGRILTICTSGRGLFDAAEEGVVARPSHAANSVTVRFLPGTASQFAQLGLTCRGLDTASAPCVNFLVCPAQGNRERAGWSVRLLIRNIQGEIAIVAECPLLAPVVAYGRIMKPIWLRLAWQQASVAAEYSTNGKEWNQVGKTLGSPDSELGIVASSGIKKIEATVRCDAIAIDGRQFLVG